MAVVDVRTGDLTPPATADAHAFWAKSVTPDKLEHYWACTQQTHRQALVNRLHTIPFSSVLELGSMAGTNLMMIHRAFPWVQLIGCDILPASVDFARARLPASTLLYEAGPLEFLTAQPDKAVDVIFTCYTLAYFDRHDVVPILHAMLRTARKAILLAEPTTQGGTGVIRTQPMPEWAHDYGVILHSTVAEDGLGAKVETLPLLQPVDHCNAVTCVVWK